MFNIYNYLDIKPLNKFSYLNMNNLRFYLMIKHKALYNISTFVKSKKSLFNSIFNNLATFLRKNPINKDTQFEIEFFLLF